MSDELLAKISEANDLADGSAKVELLEILARTADEQNDVRTGVIARFYLFNAANSADMPERLIAVYTHLRGMPDEVAEVSEDFLLEAGAYVIARLDEFPEIPMAQIDALCADQEELYEAHGHPRRELLRARVGLLHGLGRIDAAKDVYARWLEAGGAPRCAACDTNQKVWFLSETGRDAEAIEAAAPIVTGAEACEVVPTWTWGELLLPHARRGEWALARAYYARAHDAMLERPSNGESVARSLSFAAADRELVKSRALFEVSLPHAIGKVSKLGPLRFSIGAIAFLTAFAETKNTIALRTPTTFALHDPAGTYDVATLRAWFEDHARALAARFDDRNGNDFYARALASACDVLSLHR